METHFCLQCSHEQSYVGAISNYIYCERCGSKIHADGSVSYEGTREANEEMQEQIDKFDSRYGR